MRGLVIVLISVLIGGAVPPATASASSACRASDRGRLVGSEQVAAYPTAASVQAYFEQWVAFYQDYYLFPPDIPATFEYGFDSYKVTYCTLDAQLPGQTRPLPTLATGMVSVPRRNGPLSTVVYLHGTSVSFYDAVSNPNIAGTYNEHGESFDGPPANAIFAGAGFITIAPDYLGLGDSTLPRHRYFHAETEASAASDLLTASHELLERLGVEQDSRRFLFGFSQGGHAALALHRALQRAQILVTGTATVGGIFDVERWFLSSLANRTTVTLPLYVSYLLLAYDDVYDVYQEPEDVFRRRYAQTVPGLFDMRHSFDEVLGGLPPHARTMLKPAYFADVTANQRDPLRDRLRENSVDRWRPDAPVLVYHSRSDEEITFGDALVSVARLQRRGANVTLQPLEGYDHVNSWVQAMPRAVTWFRSLD